MSVFYTLFLLQLSSVLPAYSSGTRIFKNRLQIARGLMEKSNCNKKNLSPHIFWVDARNK